MEHEGRDWGGASEAKGAKDGQQTTRSSKRQGRVPPAHPPEGTNPVNILILTSRVQNSEFPE